MTTPSTGSSAPRRPHLLAAVLALACASAWPVCAAAAGAEAAAPPVIFGGDASGAPFEYLDDRGQPAGFDVEVLRRAASHAGVPLTIELGYLDDQIDALADGRIDVVMLPRTADREGRIEFLAQAWTLRDVMAFREGRDRYPQSLRELGAEVVAVTADSEHASALRLLPPDRRPAILLGRSPADLLALLSRGKASAVVGNALSIEYYRARAGLRLVEVPAGRVPYWLATRLGHGSRPELQRLAHAITAMRESGEIGELVEQHLGTASGDVDWSTVRSRLLTVGLAAFALLAGAVVWTRSLRQQVHQKTSALREALASAERHLQELQRTTAALQRSDALLRDAQQMAGAGSFEIDLVRGEVTWTPGLFRLLGLDPAHGVPRGEALDPFLAPDDRARLREATRSAREGRDAEVVVAVTRADGEPAVHHVVMRGVRDEGGPVVAVRGTSLDITRQREHEEQLAAIRDRAIEATAAKSAFLAVMSHELRTPLNGVIGMTTLLLDSPLTHEQRDQAETIRQCSALLLEQVNEVLDFSRVEAGKLELETAPFELRGLLEDTLQIVAERAQAKGLELMLDADVSLPSTVVGDVGRLRQVLLNLLGNAIKFTERGDVVLSARALAIDRLEFSVSDTGIGISADEMPRLFQPFSQADPSTTRRFGGTGLGLAICRQFVLLMGGEIAVESVAGAGSRFWFTALLPEAAPLDAALPILPGGSRALCVDDHPRHRAILAAMLDRANVSVETVTSLAEADARLTSGPPIQVVLLDAELDGAPQWLPPATPTMPPIVALTADAGRLVVSPQWAAILPRPVREPLLVATVGRVLGVTPSRAVMPAEPEPVVRPAAPLLGDPLVLVVDDNAVNQRVATRSLEKLGCRVDTASNGREAVEAALATPYALILMDCQMPEMDGYEATRQLRMRQHPSARTPIVAMTAGARAEDRDACLACGMDDYLSKPFTLPDLRRIVTAWAVAPVRP